jgi:hypothetical protein
MRSPQSAERNVSVSVVRLRSCNTCAPPSSSQARLENSLLSRSASGRELHDCRGSVVRVRMAVRWWKSSRDGDTTRDSASSALGVLVGVFGKDRLDPPRRRARETSYPRSDSQRGSCRLDGHIVGFRLGFWHCATSEMLRNREIAAAVDDQRGQQVSIYAKKGNADGKLNAPCPAEGWRCCRGSCRPHLSQLAGSGESGEPISERFSRLRISMEARDI